MKWLRVGIVLTVVALLAGGPAWAAKGSILRFGGASVNPTGDLRVAESESVPLGDGTTLVVNAVANVEADSAFGFCIDFERRLSDLMGLNFTVMRANHDINFNTTAEGQIVDDATGAVLFRISETEAATGDASMNPVLVGANFHFGNGGRADFYGGPFVGYVFFDSLELEGERVGVKDDFAYGAVLGVDVPFRNGKLAFSAAARYMVADAKPEDEDVALEIDPVIVQFGVGYRF